MKGSHVSFEYLKIFRDLTKTRNFRKTAEMNHITQSAVSQQLSFLEKYFGKRLIERNKGQFTVTPEGLMVLEGAHSILDIEKRMRESIRSTSNRIEGTIEIDAAYSIGLHLLPTIISGFIQKHPGVKLNVTYSHSDRIPSNILSGISDIGVIPLPVAEPQKFEIRPFISERLLYVCSPYHPHAKKRSISIKELHKQPFVAFSSNLQTRQYVDSFLLSHEVKAQIIYEGENIETLKRVVEVGGGVSILPENAISIELKAKKLRAMSFKEGPLHRECGLIFRAGKDLSRAESIFLEWVLNDKHFSKPTI